jgi:hypothetical protein
MILAMRILALLPLATVLLTSCSLQRASVAADAQRQMVGMTKPAVLACMGVPANKAAEGGVEVWAYQSGGSSIGMGNAYASASGNTAYGFGTGITMHRSCMVNVVFDGPQVSAVRYSGRTGGLLSQGEECAFAVQNCVSR